MAGKVQRKKHVQLSLESARKPERKHGGWRPGAGRKKKPGATLHSTRPEFAGRFPQHVTLRTVEGAPNMAADWLQPRIRAVIRESHKPDFRIVQYNVLGNHLHLVVEAAGKRSLALGMQGFEIRLAKRLNAALKRTGKLFEDRYHARILTTPTQVRNTLRYVLLNRRHHAAEKYAAKNWIDPWSSAAWFDGWARPLVADTWWKRELVETEAPTRRPTTWLLSTGWKRLGLIDFDDHPA
jgi:REP element-mobilizing transposase RayT